MTRKMLKIKCHHVRVNLPSYAIFIAISLFVSFTLPVPTSTDNNNKRNVCDSPECQAAAKNLKDSMDTSADPCYDFYEYACGKWSRKVRTDFLPSSTIQIRNDINNKEILDFLRKPNNENEPEAVHKARKLFSLCIDEKTVFKNGIKPVENILAQVGLSIAPPNVGNPNFDYVEGIVKALKIVGVKPFFDIGVEPNPYNRSFNVISLSKPASYMDPDTLPLYRSLLTKKASNESVSQTDFIQQAMIKMCEKSDAVICWSAFRFMHPLISFNLANYEEKREEIITRARPKASSTDTYTVYLLEELQKVTDTIADDLIITIPKFNWTKCIELLFSDVKNVTIDLSNPAKVQIVIHDIDFITDMMKFIYSSKLDKLEFELWWSVVSKLLPYTDAEMFDMENKVVSSDIPLPKTREEYCVGIVSSTLGMVTNYYTTMPKYNRTKFEVRDMVDNIKESLTDIIKQSPWMDKETKEKSLLKIDSLKSLVVYPNSIKNSRSLDDFYKYIEIKNDFLETMILNVQRYTKQQLSKYNQLNNLDEDGWIIPPSTVNAFYEPLKNTITIPAGVIGVPALKALDYGAAGFLVGHEITHGFDKTGRGYNSVGNVEDWWKRETLAIYNVKAKCFIQAYEKLGDSNSTIDENIADNAGFKEALLAYRKYVSKNGEEPLLTQFEDYTHEQLFTLGFANIWCENPTLLKMVSSLFLRLPNDVRVNGVLKNSEEFSRIWKCPRKSNMNPIKKCSIW